MLAILLRPYHVNRSTGFVDDLVVPAGTSTQIASDRRRLDIDPTRKCRIDI